MSAGCAQIGCAGLGVIGAALVGAALYTGGAVSITEQATDPVAVNGVKLDFHTGGGAVEVSSGIWGFRQSVDDNPQWVRGMLDVPAPGAGPASDYRVSIAYGPKGSPQQPVDCEQEEPLPQMGRDAGMPERGNKCFFVLQPAPGQLAKGVTVSVIGNDKTRTRGFTHHFSFAPRTHYSLVLWEGLMGI